MRALPTLRVVLAAGLALAPLSPLWATDFSVVNLVTDDPGDYPAQITDPALVNAWGIAASPTGPFWVSDNGTGVATVYSVDPGTNVPAKLGLSVTIPGDGSVTGQVFNGGGGFNGDIFLFVSEDGTISGWRGALGTTAETLQTAGMGVYKGVAQGAIGADNYLYAADFQGGTIDILKGTPGAPNLTGNFTDPNLPVGYAPFNIQRFGSTLYVAYAKEGAGLDEQAGAGFGYVDSFDLEGNLLARIASGDVLNAPWGLAIAPSSFGDLAGALLVGNFGDGRISAYDLATDSLLGQITGSDGNPLAIEGLWGLTVGNGGLAGSANRLYFTAGPDDEGHGLLGVLIPLPAPEPASWAMMIAGLGFVGFAMRRRAARVAFG